MKNQEVGRRMPSVPPRGYYKKRGGVDPEDGLGPHDLLGIEASGRDKEYTILRGVHGQEVRGILGNKLKSMVKTMGRLRSLCGSRKSDHLEPVVEAQKCC